MEVYKCREYIKDFLKDEVDKKVADLDFWHKKPVEDELRVVKKRG